MELITKQQIIGLVADSWKNQYKSKDWDTRPAFKSSHTYKEIYELLLNAKTELEISEIMGNDSWTRNKCNECDQDSNIVVRLGEPPNHESSTAKICPKCLSKAMKLIKTND